MKLAAFQSGWLAILISLGDTFADLDGGMNTIASRMPVLSPLSDGRQMIEINAACGHRPSLQIHTG